jgi:putative endopeptidase
MKNLLSIASIAALMFMASCSNSNKENKSAGEGYFSSKDFDTTIQKGDNFYKYANGAWLKKTEIPASEARWGSFSEVDELRYKILHEVLEESAADKNAKAGSNRQKVGDFYATGMDSVKLNAEGIKPIQPYIEEIDAIKTTDELLAVISKYHRSITQSGYYVYADQDAMNSSKIMVNFFQGGLGLPDKDFYFRPDSNSQSIRIAYVAFIKESFLALGYNEPNADAAAKNIFQLETDLASKSMGRVEMRDPYASYHKMTMAEFQVLTPNINWNNQLTGMQVPIVDTVIVGQPEFFKQLNSKIKSVPLNTWKDYVKYDVLTTAAPYMDDASALRSFNFYSKKLNGVKERKPRWKRVLNSTEGSLGEALGDEYVKKAFSEDSKKRMESIIENLRGTFADRIQKLDWMGDSTKAKAIEKLKKITVKVGYPDKWRDYSSMTIDRSSYFNNVLNAGVYEFQRMVNKIGKPVDRTEWGMNVYAVNAYYNPSNNEIVFPAGILQPPFFGPNLDDACIYGGIGAVICHEMSHGFDDQGSQFDADGNLKVWWTEEDRAKFKSKTDMIVAQFANYKVLDGLAVNGELTLGENIADLGGVMISLDAFKKTEQFKADKTIDSFTPMQRFFLNWARVWETKYTDAALRQQILTNPHSPGEFRCNGPISNVQDWYYAFNVSDKNSMYLAPDKRAAIW